ncbi:MAG: D-cysteine desulfhydrase [Burkholderiales bacterium]|nr:MAG: D-cysteine desulfhydrase [Burkholderiales bacterium]
MDLNRFARRRYSDGPTPIEPLPRFSSALAASCPGGVGPEVWVKRDDLLGLSPGGNKTRKLEFLVADALAQGADTLITCGAPQSNHCRITLSAAIREGLSCRFVIEERVPGSYSDEANGNHFLFRLMGVESISVVPAGTDMAAAMQKEADTLASQGRKAYVIPGGGSNALGSLGYVSCAMELQQQMLDAGMHFDALVVGSGSSGTHAGLLAGFEALGMDLPIIGIGVSRDPAQQAPIVLDLARQVCSLIGVDAGRLQERLHCVGGFWQPKYSVPNRRMVEAVHMLARTEALLLDPVYTGKIMAGLIGLARESRWSAGQRILFLHTGGMPSLFWNPAPLLGTAELAP